MKMLMIGFEPKKNILYPHTKYVADEILGGTGDYFCLHERDFLTGYRVNSARAIYLSVANMFRFFIEVLMLRIKIAKHDYEIIVAIDNVAFSVASIMSNNVVLWSHDFVGEDQNESTSVVQRYIRRMTKRSLKKNPNLIIQDQDRLNLFTKNFTVQIELNVFFLPVSLRACSVSSRKSPDQRPIILQIGGINSYRSCSDVLLGHYQTNHDSYDLFFHGFLDNGFMKEVQVSGDKLPWISSAITDPYSLYKVIMKCDIGFVCYATENQNFYYISRASNQLVEFLRCGKPIIHLGKNTLADYVSEKRVGVSIVCISELDAAISEVVLNYSLYSDNAFKAFQEEYNLDNYLPSLKGWLDGGI